MGSNPGYLLKSFLLYIKIFHNYPWTIGDIIMSLYSLWQAIPRYIQILWRERKREKSEEFGEKREFAKVFALSCTCHFVVCGFCNIFRRNKDFHGGFCVASNCAACCGFCSRQRWENFRRYFQFGPILQKKITELNPWP